jgi:oligopeptide transport system ATP-binding protein
MTDRTPPLLAVHNLRVHFPLRRGVLRRSSGLVQAVENISFAIAPGETLGLVGESGCGKSTTARAILQIVRPTAGQVILDGHDLTRMRGEPLRKMRRTMQMMFQDPYTSLNPRMTLGAIVGEPVRVHRLRSSKAAVEARVEELFHLVGLAPALHSRYPYELSGGQRQRIGIARALAVEPRLVVCDEPVSALDVSVQAQILNLLGTLQRQLGLTYLFIAHDLSIIRHMSTHVAVMYLGKVVELGRSARVYHTPRHPYTCALLSAIPHPDPRQTRQRARIILTGDVPSPTAPPTGCRFHPRCPLVVEQCRHEEPPFALYSEQHHVACWRAHETEELWPVTGEG